MTLSDRSGVPYNTVRRIANGQVDKPTLETVLAIPPGGRKPTGRGSICERILSGTRGLFSHSQEASQTQFVTDHVIDSLKDDQVAYRIFSVAGTCKLCASAGGTSKDNLANGLEKVQAMIEEGFLYEDDKGVFRTVVREYCFHYGYSRDS